MDGVEGRTRMQHFSRTDSQNCAGARDKHPTTIQESIKLKPRSHRLGRTKSYDPRSSRTFLPPLEPKYAASPTILFTYLSLELINTSVVYGVEQSNAKLSPQCSCQRSRKCRPRVVERVVKQRDFDGAACPASVYTRELRLGAGR